MGPHTQRIEPGSTHTMQVAHLLGTPADDAFYATVLSIGLGTLAGSAAWSAIRALTADKDQEGV